MSITEEDVRRCSKPVYFDILKNCMSHKSYSNTISFSNRRKEVIMRKNSAALLWKENIFAFEDDKYFGESIPFPRVKKINKKLKILRN